MDTVTRLLTLIKTSIEIIPVRHETVSNFGQCNVKINWSKGGIKGP